jgi:hypothetical protein
VVPAISDNRRTFQKRLLAVAEKRARMFDDYSSQDGATDKRSADEV